MIFVSVDLIGFGFYKLQTLNQLSCVSELRNEFYGAPTLQRTKAHSFIFSAMSLRGRRPDWLVAGHVIFELIRHLYI